MLQDYLNKKSGNDDLRLGSAGWPGWQSDDIASNTMTKTPKEIMMARMVKRTHSGPYKLVVGGEEKYLCQCGLSRNQPFCDGSHKLAKDEDVKRLCWYDDAGKRHEHSGDFPDIRTF